MTQLSQIFRASLCGAILLLCMGACSKDLMPDLSVEPATTADRSGGGTVPVTVTPIEDIAGGIDTTQLNEGAGVVVRFSKGDGEFAFDAAEQDWYRRALLVRDKYEEFGEGYIAPWKLVPVGENDTVEAVIAEGKAKPEDIGFVLKDGTGVPAKENGGKWTLTLPSVGSGEKYEVFAVLKKRNGNLTVGKLNVVSYPTQTRTVTLVPVFERFSDIGAVERELNEIYKPHGVTFTVAEDNSMIGVWDWDLDGDGALNLDGSGFFSNETDEMKALRQAYQATGNYDRNGYYLFVMRSAKADTEPEFTAAGDMPRGKQFGYLFSADPGPSLSRLAAHELGHGIFTLTHTFDSNYGGGDSRAQTPNLMDYADGIDLGAFQWSVIAKPAPLTWFDNEEDGMVLYNNKDCFDGKITWELNKEGKRLFEFKKALEYDAAATCTWSDNSKKDILEPRDYVRTYFRLTNGDLFRRTILNGMAEMISTTYEYYPQELKEWGEVRLADFETDCLSCALEHIAHESYKATDRYILPVSTENLFIVVYGKDFDGNEVSRFAAGGFLVLDVIKVGKLLKYVKRADILIRAGRTALARRVVLTGVRDMTRDVVIDMSAQFAVNLVSECIANPNADINDIIDMAFHDIDLSDASRAAWDNIISKTVINDQEELVLKCAEGFFKNIKEHGFSGKGFLYGGYDCLLTFGIPYVLDDLRDTGMAKELLAKLNNAQTRDIVMQKISVILRDEHSRDVIESVIDEALHRPVE